VGIEIDREDFDSDDFRRFDARLARCLEVLETLLERPGFGEGPSSLGAELEVTLVDQKGHPLPLNHEVLRRTLDPRMTFELDRFNLECNLRHTELAGRPFAHLRRELESACTELSRAARAFEGRIAMIGILPTLEPADLRPSAMTDSARYRALSRSLRAARRGPFQLEISGDDPLSLACEDVTYEGAATSLQIHLRVDPSDFALEVKLTRLGGQLDLIRFTARADHLVSTSSIAEPHSFGVWVEAVHAGERHVWEFESLEGRTRIDPEMARSLGVETSIAGPATLVQTVTVYGRVRVNPERVRDIRARFDGVVRGVHARLGSSVRKGEKLLSIESNESLNLYSIEAPISGVVTQRDANPGEQTSGGLLMTITDTSSVWVDLSVFPVDRVGVGVGSPVSITPALGGTAISGVVSLLETMADEHDQSVVARVALEDAGSELRPGTFVTAKVQVGEYEVPLAVRQTGLQSFRDFRVVFAQVGEDYEVRMLDLGRRAGQWVEVLGGLAPGTRYVTSNSHLIKADIEKSGASHNH
jgi:cobalt-zinc-cadmium efflux system membrane fusion protein